MMLIGVVVSTLLAQVATPRESFWYFQRWKYGVHDNREVLLYADSKNGEVVCLVTRSQPWHDKIRFKCNSLQSDFSDLKARRFDRDLRRLFAMDEKLQ